MIPNSRITMLFSRQTRALGALLLALAVAPSSAAHAQVITGYGVAYGDGDETLFGLLGATVAPAGLGLQPVGSLEVYGLSYPGSLDDRVQTFGVAPGAGVQYQTEGGVISARASYHFVNAETAGRPFFNPGADGVATTLQAIYWAGPSVETLVNYHWASDFLWSEAKVHFGVAPAIEAGAEGIWLHDGEADSGSVMLGPSVRWVGANGFTVGVAGGAKLNDETENTWYTRIGLSVQP